MTGRITVRADAGSQLLHLLDELRPCHCVKVSVHKSSPFFDGIQACYLFHSRLCDNASGQNMVLPGQVPGDVLLSAIDLLAAQDHK